MGSGSNSTEVNLYCTCQDPGHTQRRQTMAKIYPREGIEVVSRSHGTHHIGSISVHNLLRLLAGTQDGSAINSFVRQVVGT